MISKKQVEHIAKLARIELTEQEKEKFTKELSSVLDYVEQLKKVDTKKIKSIRQITGLENIMREDKKNKSPKSKVQRGDYIKVPKILE